MSKSPKGSTNNEDAQKEEKLSVEEENILTEEKKIKPNTPASFNIEQAISDVKTKSLKIRRYPG